MGKSNDELVKRKYIRFPADALAVAKFSLSIESETFDPTHVALIMDEAPLGGCGLLFHGCVDLATGAKIKIKVGELSPVVGEVCWVKKLEEEVYKFGIQFLE